MTINFQLHFKLEILLDSLSLCTKMYTNFSHIYILAGKFDTIIAEQATRRKHWAIELSRDCSAATPFVCERNEKKNMWNIWSTSKTSADCDKSLQMARKVCKVCNHTPNALYGSVPGKMPRALCSNKKREDVQLSQHNLKSFQQQKRTTPPKKSVHLKIFKI